MRGFYRSARILQKIRSPCLSPQRAQSSLAGSAPSYKGHLILESDLPSSHWPSKVESLYPLLPALQSLAQDEASPLHGFGFALTTSTRRPRQDSAVGSTSGSSHIHGASLCLPTSSQVLEAPGDVQFDQPLNDVLAQIQRWIPEAPRSTTPGALSPLHIFVCTHGARDCRCGTLGSAFYQQLQSAASRQSPSIQDQIRVREISHIGGHKYAANVLAYPLGDWYGNLDPTDADDFMWSLLDMRGTPKQEQRDRMIWWQNWRGRLGLSAQEAADLYERTSGQSLSSTTRSKHRSRPAGELGDAVEVRFKSWDGDEFSHTGFTGETLKDVAKRHDLVEAICGGVQECATCHVMLQGENLPEQPDMSDDEDEQLEYTIKRTPESRLSCCIPITPELGQWMQSGQGHIALPRF